MLTTEALVDRFARRVTYLRVSLTDRCNYRCTYCMPEAGIDLLPRAEILAFEEIVRVVGVFAKLGVTRVRLTGGEPTMRHGVEALVAMLAGVPGIDEVVMTTNGHRLAELAGPLARAGLGGLNVSLDTLDEAKFRAITRRGELGRVISGIEAARAAGIARLKINVVALRGWNADEIGALCDFAWARGATPRFIEWMPMSGGELYAPGELLPAAAILSRIAAHTGTALAPVSAANANVGPARYFRVDDGRCVGVISAMSETFCAGCNRVRLDAVGALHTCLAHDDATDLRAILRRAGSDEELTRVVRGALAGKRERHALDGAGCSGPAKHMVSIGG